VNPASWAWVALATIIILGVAVFDTWAYFAGQVSMSAQLRTWLSGELTGPLVVGLWMGLFFALLWHWIVRIKGP
jgi:uncharacterized membrane protein YedE/YeeE